MSGFLARWGHRIGRALTSWGLGAVERSALVEVEIDCRVSVPRDVAVDTTTPLGVAVIVDGADALSIGITAASVIGCAVRALNVDTRSVAIEAASARAVVVQTTDANEVAVDIASRSAASVAITVAEAA